MRPNTIRRGTDERHRGDSAPEPDLRQLSRLAKQLRHTARLAGMALSGNDPAMGVDYLFDALEILQAELRPLRRGRPRLAT